MGGGEGAAGGARGRGPRVGSASAERSNDGVERKGMAGDAARGPGLGLGFWARARVGYLRFWGSSPFAARAPRSG